MRTLTPLLFLLAAPAAGQEVDFDLRAARHLWNRAGFGASPGRLEKSVEQGLEATLERLFKERETDPFAAERVTWLVDKKELKEQGPDAVRRARNDLRKRDREQREAYLDGWMERLLSGREPLRERMTLFWHGLFTSQASKVKDSYLLVRQSQLLHGYALESYGDLLRAVLHDPAMLRYLDNDSNEREHPNENLARELLELFSLGEGNYTERDVKEVARALTGYGYDDDHEFRFTSKKHDHSKKSVLGIKGRHDADSVVDVLLAQPACGRWVAGRVITYLEGIPPEAERLEDYASYLRARNYELGPFLLRLFRDPDFYRPEVIGARVASPVDYLVGHSRRLGLNPAPHILVEAASFLGEELFEPPNVKGWEGGHAWITTSTFMARGNVMGSLLGVVGSEELKAPEGGALEPMDEADMAAMEPMSEAMETTEVRRKDQLSKLVRSLDRDSYTPDINLSRKLMRADLERDREIVDELCSRLLAIEAPLETRRMLASFLREERKSMGFEQGELLGAGDGVETLLRRLAHLILSLPEAQLG